MTNAGFADVIEIARQDRPSLYDPSVDRPEPLVPASAALEVRGRLDADGASSSRSARSLPTMPDGRRGGGGVPAARRPRTRPTSMLVADGAARPTATT